MSKVIQLYAEDVPAKLVSKAYRGKRYIVGLVETCTGRTVYVADTCDPRAFFDSTVNSAYSTRKSRASAISDHFREAIKTRIVTVRLVILQCVPVRAYEDGTRPTLTSIAAEESWLEKMRSAGEELVNKPKRR